MAKSSVKLIDSTVFDSFNTLHSDDQKQRISGSLKLLQHLTKTDTEGEKKSKEYEYTLKRLIRGLGASTCASRTGFFTTFIAFLNANESSTSISDLFTLMHKELNVGKEVATKDDSDALIGQILLCGALIRCGKILHGTDAELKESIEILVKASKQKLVHASLAYTFLICLLEMLPERQFNAVFWPAVEKNLGKQWEKQTINTFHLLITIQLKYPQIIDRKFLQKSLKTDHILSPISFKHIGRLLWGNTSMTAAAHPVYDAFGLFLKNCCQAEQLKQFWIMEVNETLAAPNKIKEIITLKVLSDLISGDNPINVHTLKQLICRRFIKMISNSMRNTKQQKHDYVRAFYDEFFESLQNYFDKIPDDDDASDAIKFEIIEKFLLHPGTLMLEKFTTNKVIHQLASKLGPTSLGRLFDLYKNVLLGKITKNPDDSNGPSSWQNVEKQHAIYMLQHLLSLKVAHSNLPWRTEQMKFIIGQALFYTTADGQPTKKETDAGNLSKDLCGNLKNVFYTSLQTKLSSLNDEKQLLFDVVSFVHSIIGNKKNGRKCLRDSMTDKIFDSWIHMFDRVNQMQNERKRKEEKIDQVFSILFLQMGLQLYREPIMAQTSIADLEKCFENAKQKRKQQQQQQKKKKATDAVMANDDVESEQPEWIEVIVDLFLHLLSQNMGFLRTVVNTVFPHLCEHMNLTAICQILSVLDMKDGKNPLSESNESNEADDSSSDEDENDEDDDDDNDNDNDNDNDDNDNDEENDEDDENEDLMDADDDDEEGTISDQLRNAISIALGSAKQDDDNESIDLNDLSDTEAERLDNILTDAFKMNRKSNSKKKTKKDRVTATTLMHFRIRVLDLLEIYLKNRPKLAITLEILIALFNMIEFCIEKDLQPLSLKLNRVLMKLLALRQLENVDIGDVSEEQLCQLLDDLLKKKINPIVIDNHHKLLSKCYAFIVNCSQLISAEPNSETIEVAGTKTVLGLSTEYLKEFITTRNPIVPYGLLQDIFRIRWNGLWHLSKTLAKKGLRSKTRTFRRSQTLDLLALIYKNHGFIKQNADDFISTNRSIEKVIVDHLHMLCNVDSISAKEFSSLIGLLLEMNKCHRIPDIQSNDTALNWKMIADQVQELRQKVMLVSIQTYASLCRCLGITVHKKNATTTNGIHANGTSEHDDEGNDNSKSENVQVKIEKRKKDTDPPQSKKLKRLKKEERLRLASEGFSTSISFAADSLLNGQTTAGKDEDMD